MTRPLSYTIEGNDRLSDILERLDKRLDQLDRTMGKVASGASAMGRKLDDAERQTKQLGDSANQSQSKLDGFGTKLGDMTKKVSGYAAAVAAAGAAAAVAVAAAGAAFAAEKSKVDALLAGQVGVSGAQAKELGRVAGELYAEGWAESVGEAAEAVRSTIENQLVRLDAAGEPIDRLAVRTAATAQMMREDFDRVTAAVSTMLRTRIAQDAEQAFDLLTAATQRGLNKSQDLLDTMTEYSVQFQALGIDAPKALGLMIQALDAGARNSDVAADAIKEFAIRSKDGSATSRQAFKDLGLDAEQMFDVFAKGGPQADAAMKKVLEKLKLVKDDSNRTAIAVQLFGTKAEDLQASLLAMDPTTAVAALGDVREASDEFIDSQTSAGQRLDEMWRRVQISVGDKFLPVIEKVIEKIGELAADPEIQRWLSDLERGIAALTPMIEGAFDFMMKSFGDNKEEMILGLAGLIGTIALLVSALMGLAGVVAHVAGFMHESFKFSTNLVLGYIGFFVNAVAKAFGWIPGLGPKLQEAADNFNAFRDKVNNALNGIKDKSVKVTVSVTGSGAKYTQGGSGSEIPFGGGFQERAAGGPVWPGQVYRWQEQGSEWLMLGGGSGRVLSNQDVRSAQSGDGDQMLGVVKLVLTTEEGQVIQEKLLKFKRQRGLRTLRFEAV